MNVNIWKHGRVSAAFTTESPVSHYGIPVLRIKHPAGNGDFGPGDLLPASEDEPPGTGAALVVKIHQAKPLDGEALTAAKSFLSQWPAGPQIK